MSSCPVDCTTPRRPYLLGANIETKQAVLFQPRCKQWKCPYCAEVNKALWAARGFHGAQELSGEEKTINFLTLTSHEKLSPAASLAVWPKAWQKLRQRAYRAADHFDYLLVPEQHKDGRLHVHAVETAGLGERWWKNNGRECGLGFMAEEEEAHTPAGAAFYVVKYLTKSIAYQDWPRGFRRVRVSRGWPKLPDMPEVPGWDWLVLKQNQSLDATIEEYQAAGFDVRLLGSREAWDYIKVDCTID